MNDTYTANYADALKAAKDIAASGATMSLRKLTDLYKALNTCLVLNPGRTPDDRSTAIDILASAEPKRVLIHIGVNNGLWELLLMADPTDFANRINPIADMRTLALHLKESCPATEHFYINLFPKPSAVANLSPPWTGDTAPIPVDGYYDKYVGHLLGTGGLTRVQMREIDNWVRDDLNPRVQGAFAPLGGRAHFVDLYASAVTYDRKNGTNTKEVILHHGRSPFLLDNRAIEVTPFGGLGGFGGGLFGLDNLHPTIVGYGLIAQSVCDVIAETEGLPAPEIDLQACYDADNLLNNLPPTVGLADFALQFVGAFIPLDSLAATA